MTVAETGKLPCANPSCGHRQYWHGGDDINSNGSCTRAECPCTDFVPPEENTAEPASDLSENELIVMAKEMVGSIRKVRIVFLDEKGSEIWETGGDVMPGDELTIKAPAPDNVQVSDG